MKATDIRRMREKAGITQADLARLLGVSPVSVNRWELGRRTPDDETLKQISATLRSKPDTTASVRSRRTTRTVLIAGTGEGLLTDGSSITTVNVIDLREPLTPKQKQQLSDLAQLAEHDASPDTARVLANALLQALTR